MFAAVMASWTLVTLLVKLIDQFRCIKIQSQTMDFRARLWGINPTNSIYSPEPRTEVYCLRLNFNISKLVYSHTPKVEIHHEDQNYAILVTMLGERSYFV